MDEPDWLRAERAYGDEVTGDDTLPEAFEAAADRRGDADAQWYKGGVYDRSLVQDVVPAAPDGEFATLSYDEMRGIVRNLAAGFRELGVRAGDRVGIFANTRMEWAQSDFALLAAGAVVTTVYTESSPERVRYLLDDPGATGVVVENADLLERVRAVEDDLDLAFVVVVDAHDPDRDDTYTLADVHDRGAEAFDEDAYRGWLDDRSLSDLASLVYTSGTTGRPKGVELTHGNFRANVNQVRKRFAPRPDRDESVPTIDEDTRTLSFLPLAHVFERLAGHFYLFASGGTVAYAESPDTVSSDLETVAPSGATSVPRVYERVFDSMREEASGGVSERVFGWAVDVAREYARAEDPGVGLRARHAVADALVFSTVREELGGNVDAFVSGGGSIARELEELFEGMGLPIAQGYGLTETAPVVAVNPPEDTRPGTLGVPVVGCDVKLDETVVSDERREAADGEVGELLVRGPNVTSGYWNRPEATEEAFTDGAAEAVVANAASGESNGAAREESDGAAREGSDGVTNGESDGDVIEESDGDTSGESPDVSDERYFRTGDVVERTDDGYLVYHDRLKQLLVLDTGKNVAPQPIEDEFATSERVEQVMVVGDDEKFLGALVVPNLEAARGWADDRGVDLPDDPETACRDERVREFVAAEIDRVNQTRPKSERIRDFELVATEWTAENGLLTPSMKKKRSVIREEFEAELDALYGRA